MDHYWHHLSREGDAKAQVCGWRKDRFGLSWQIVPSLLPQLLCDPDPARVQRVMTAMMQMKKIDLAVLKRAAD